MGKNKIFFILVLYILSFSLFIKIDAQETSPIATSQKFNVKIGESNTYEFKNIQIGTDHYLQILDPRTNITEGTKVTFTIVNKNVSSSGLENVFFNGKLAINNEKIYELPAISAFSISTPGLTYVWLSTQSMPNIITYGFTNSTSAFLYYNETIYMSYSSPSQYHITTNGNYLTVIRTRLLLRQQTETFTWKLNWKTGWLKSYKIDMRYDNGTITMHYELQRITKNYSNNIFNLSVNDIELGMLTIIIAVPVLIGLSYINYTNKFKNSNQHITFKAYIVKIIKFKKSKQKKEINLTSDKTFEMLEEIIEETK